MRRQHATDAGMADACIPRHPLALYMYIYIFANLFSFLQASIPVTSAVRRQHATLRIIERADTGPQRPAEVYESLNRAS